MPGPTVIERLVADVARQIRLRRAEFYGLRGLFWGALAAVVPLVVKESFGLWSYVADDLLLVWKELCCRGHPPGSCRIANVVSRHNIRLRYARPALRECAAASTGLSSSGSESRSGAVSAVSPSPASSASRCGVGSDVGTSGEPPPQTSRSMRWGVRQ